MPGSSHSTADWPLFDVRLEHGDVSLRPVREVDLPLLAALQPDDYEHDPRAETFAGLDAAQHRARLVHQDYWRSLGTWSPDAWSLAFLVEHDGAPVGMQSLEAEGFGTARTVDSGSWLVPAARGRGIGGAMREAVLALAFDHLGALAAITSARRDNAASLGVSRSLGYVDDGVRPNPAGDKHPDLQHLRLDVAAWRASGRGRQVRVVALTPCLAWFGLAPEDRWPGRVERDHRTDLAKIRTGSEVADRSRRRADRHDVGRERGDDD